RVRRTSTASPQTRQEALPAGRRQILLLPLFGPATGAPLWGALESIRRRAGAGVEELDEVQGEPVALLAPVEADVRREAAARPADDLHSGDRGLRLSRHLAHESGETGALGFGRRKDANEVAEPALHGRCPVRASVYRSGVRVGSTRFRTSKE